MPPLPLERSHQRRPSHPGHDPPLLPSSTRGLNDARFRGRWAGRPRSFETWVGKEEKKKNPSQASWFSVVTQFARPATSHQFLPKRKTRNGRNLRSAGSAPFGSAQLPPLLPFTLSFRPGSTEVGWREPLDRRCYCVEAVLSLDQGCLADKRVSGLEVPH